MSAIPDGIVLERHRDGKHHLRWASWVGIAALAIFLLLGLLNVFGQQPTNTKAESSVAVLEVSAPPRIRGGLLYQARFTVHARQELKDAILVLSSGWLEGMTVNTVEPSPVGEASRDGGVAFELGHVPAGRDYVLYVQFQVNPTNVGRRDQDVELDDGAQRLLFVHRKITVLF